MSDRRELIRCGLCPAETWVDNWSDRYRLDHSLLCPNHPDNVGESATMTVEPFRPVRYRASVTVSTPSEDGVSSHQEHIVCEHDHETEDAARACGVKLRRVALKAAHAARCKKCGTK